MSVPVKEAPGSGTIHSLAPAPQSATPKPVRPLTFFLAPIALFLLVDILFFRSNFYTAYLEPLSSEGTFEGALEYEKARSLDSTKAVIVMGSSRIAEGFSAKQANQLEPQGGYYFINGAVSGAGPRCLYYFIRDLDPDRNRYKTLVITIDDYTDPDDYEDLTDRIEDLHSVIARVRLRDVIPFTQSFTTLKIRWTVLTGTLLKSLVYQRDLQEFLDHPMHRLEKAALYQRSRWDWNTDYTGRDRSLAGTTINWSTKTVTFPPNISLPDQIYMSPRMINTAPQKGRVRDFQVRWLSALAELYRNSTTRIIFIQAPRAPVPRPTPLAHLPFTTVDILAKYPWVTVVDPHTFENLERPELFADHVHLNKEGRKRFTPALVATIKSVLEPH